MAKKYTNKPKEFVIVEGGNPPHTHTPSLKTYNFNMYMCDYLYTNIQVYKYDNFFFFLSLTLAHNLSYTDISNFLCPFPPPDDKHKFFEHLQTRKMTVADMYNNNNENKNVIKATTKQKYKHFWYKI